MKLWKYIIVLVELFAPVAVLAGAYAVDEEHYSSELPTVEQTAATYHDLTTVIADRDVPASLC